MDKTFKYRNKRKMLSIPVDSIIYLENVKRKVRIHTVDGNFEYYGKLSEAVIQLDERFVMFHRSYVVNLDYVIALQNKSIKFLGGGSIQLGQHTYTRFKNMVKNQIYS